MLEYKSKIVAVLEKLFPQAKIYLFGSRATKTHRKTSDIDIALDVGKRMTFGEIGTAKEEIEKLNIPFFIDVVDMRNIPSTMKNQILKEGIVWKN